MIRYTPKMLPWAQIFRWPFTPLRHSAAGYNRRKLGKDLLAGLTVSFVEVPQAMAYALIAGVPPEYGLYASIVQGLLAAIFSSSEHMATGPTNTQSLLVAAAAQRLMGDPSGPVYLELVAALAILKGLIQLAFAAANMGTLIRYVSRSVVIGVAAGAGVLIVVNQIPAMLGLRAAGHRAPDWLPDALSPLHFAWLHLDAINSRAVMLCAATLFVVMAGRVISRFIPGALLAMIGAGAVVTLLGWMESVPLVPIVDASPAPRFALPHVTLAQVELLFTGAAALAVLGMIESVSIAKSIASHSGQRIDANREFFAQGVANIVSGFFQGLPGSASFTRSAMDHQAGAQTRFAAIFNVAFVALIFWVAAPLAHHVPLAALAGVLLAIAAGLVDWRYILRIARSNRDDAVVCLITFVAVLVAPLQYAVFVGIFVNIALYLRKASQLHIAQVVEQQNGNMVERTISDSAGQDRITFLQLEGDLFFGVADELQDRLTQISAGRCQVVILRLKRTHSLDATVLEVLSQFIRQMQSQGRHVLFCGIRPPVAQKLQSFGITRLVGSENVFPAAEGVFTSAKAAMHRAKELTSGSIDVSGLSFLDDPEGWSYAI